MAKLNYNYYWFFILSLVPIRRKKTEEYERSNLFVIQLILFIAIYFALYFIFNAEPLHVLQYGSKIIDFMTYFNLVTNAVLMMIILLTGLFKWKMLVEIKRNVAKIDQFITTKKQKRFLRENDRKLGYVTIVCVLFGKCWRNLVTTKRLKRFSFLVFVGYYGIGELVFSTISGLMSMRHLIRYVIPTAISTNMKLQYFLLTSLICNRFCALNTILVEQSKEIVNKKHGNSSNFKNFLESILDVHDQLTILSRKLNDFYSFQLLVSFGILCSLIIVNGYVLLYTLTMGYNVQVFYILYAGFKFTILHTFEILLLVIGSANLCNEVSKFLLLFFLEGFVLL